MNSSGIGRSAWSRRILLAAGLAFCAPVQAQSGACATVAADVSGSAQFQIGSGAQQPVFSGGGVPLGALITTDANTSVVLRFSDEQLVVLGENTRFRVVNCQFDPKEMGKSGVFLNLIEGSARLVMGAIGQHDPRLVRIQVGTGTVAGAQSPDGTRGADAAVSVQGAVTLLEVSQGRVSLTLPTGQSVLVSAGEGALVRPDGTVQQGNVAQIAAQAGQTPDGKLMVSRLDQLESFVFPQRGPQTTITLATPTTTPAPPSEAPPGAAAPAAPTAPADAPVAPAVAVAPLPATVPDLESLPPTGAIAPQPIVLDLPPLVTATTGTFPTGASGGGTPCGASCN